MKVRNSIVRELTPVSAVMMPTIAVMPVTSANPHGMRVGRIAPVSPDPHPADAVPFIFAANPDVTRSGRDHDRFHRWRRRSLLDNWCWPKLLRPRWTAC